MTEFEIRKMYVDRAISYYGTIQGDDRHKSIVDAYNLYLPHPRGYVLTITDPWCAAFASACAELTDLVDIIPVECSCKNQIELFKKMDRWEERDDYVPSPGDLLYYDWDDNGKGDCTGNPEHVGIIVTCSNGALRVIEGNKGDNHVVGYRDVPVNGRYIRGFGLPDFASKATETPKDDVALPLPVLQYGDKGEAVKALQTLLNLRLNCALNVDGSFGPVTLSAVKTFQGRCEIAVDGSCGPVTWGRLING